MKPRAKHKSSPSEDDALLYTGGTGVEEEQTESEETITEPFDPTKIRVETKSMTIDLLLTRMEEEELDLAPGFQRKGGIWTDAAQSRLIESILIRIPLPAFYMDATDDNKWLVVDGLQRLTTLKRFVLEDELSLDGLEFLSNVKGKTFSTLPRNFQRRIRETQITVYLIEKGTPVEVKFNIFKRINTGGLPLSAQEIRHALNQGKVTAFLQELAASAEFVSASDGSIRDTRMADRECVLRFLAFRLTDFEDYKSKDFDGFLNERMAALNRMHESELRGLAREFKKAMVAAKGLFGRDAFRKRYYIESSRYPISKALFEAWSVNLSQLTDSQLELLHKRKANLQVAFMALMRNHKDFDSAISQGTGDPNKVRLRFGQVRRIIGEVLK